MRALKRIGIIVAAVGLLLVCMLLALQWSAGAKDAEIRQKILGTWTTDWNEDFAWKFEAEANVGKFTKLFRKGLPEEWSANGTWRVERGILILTITNAPFPSLVGMEEYPVIQIDVHEMKLVNGTEPPLTAHKK